MIVAGIWINAYISLAYGALPALVVSEADAGETGVATERQRDRPHRGQFDGRRDRRGTARAYRGRNRTARSRVRSSSSSSPAPSPPRWRRCSSRCPVAADASTESPLCDSGFPGDEPRVGLAPAMRELLDPQPLELVGGEVDLGRRVRHRGHHARSERSLAVEQCRAARPRFRRRPYGNRPGCRSRSSSGNRASAIVTSPLM